MTPPSSRSSGGPRPSSSQTPPSTQSDSTQPDLPFPPTATTALGALDQLLELLEVYNKAKGLALKRKAGITVFVDLARKLFVSELADARAGSPSTGSDPPASAAHAQLVELQATMRATQQAVSSLRGELKQTVTSSLREVLESSPPARPASSNPAPQTSVARSPRDSPRHLEVTIGIPQASRNETIAKLSASQLKNEVDAALDASGIVGLAGTRVCAVRRLPNGSLLVATSPEEPSRCESRA
ncbi:hypothetical protein C8T65DRAFT_749175 [Cerioporus squamosus]|nr:hypothetical protein C8T65DRAFT_749175 [Cerioporus squamosus]